MNLRLDVQAQIIIVRTVALLLADQIVQVQNATLPPVLAHFRLLIDNLVLFHVQNDVLEGYISRILPLTGRLLFLLLNDRFLANRIIDKVLVEHKTRIRRPPKLMKQLIYIFLLCLDVLSYASLKLTPHLDLRQ